MKYLLIVLICLPLYVVAQNKDSENLISKGDNFRSARNYDSALYYYNEFLEHFAKDEIDRLCNVLNSTSDIYNRTGQEEKSIEAATRVIELCNSINPEEVAKAYVNLSNTLAIYYSDFDSALNLANKAIEVLKSNSVVSKALFQAYRSQGVTYYDLVQYDKAVESYQYAIKVLDDIGGGQELNASILNNLANAYDGLGKYHKALQTHFLALKIKKSIFPEVHPEIAMSLNNIGNSYHYLEQYSRALDYFNLALHQRMDLFGLEHRRVASVYNNLGNVYFDQGDYVKSKEAHAEALEIRKKVFHPDHSIFIYSYTNLGNSHALMNDPDSSQYYFEKAISLHKKNYGETTDLLATIYQNMALHHKREGHQNKGENFTNEAISHFVSNYGWKHPKVGANLNVLAAIKLDQSDHSGALEVYQKALISLVEDFDSQNIATNPSSEKVLDPGELIKVLKGKTQSLYYQYINAALNKKDQYYQRLVRSLNASDQYIQRFRKEMTRRSDLQNLGEQSISIYNIWTAVNYDKYVRSSEETYLDSVLVCMEKSKSNLLFLKLMDSRAQIESSIPDSLLSLQTELQLQINKYKSSGDLAQVSIVQREYDEFLKSLERKFPDYFELKHNYQFGSINSIQNGLNHNEAFIEYQVVDSLLFCLYIEKGGLRVKKTILPDDFPKMVGDYMKYLGDPSITLNSQTIATIEKLTSILIGDIVGESAMIDHLIIVPDGLIGNIPFETLRGFDEDDFLIRKFDVQYAYSAKTLFHNRQPSETEELLTYGGFAPVYDHALDKEQFSTLRSSITPLHWNKNEVESTGDILNGDKYMGSEATESNFINYGEKYRILHLAMHAVLDNANSLNSRLYFDLLSDSVHDGVLHAFEVYNLNLSADLVVLSACNSGSGEFSEGEGVMSLAHAFRYSGASSILMSHWPVDDNSTYQLVSSFFNNISSGQAKSAALRNAKLEFLAKAEPERQHPFFWASFTLIGKNDGIDVYSSNRYYSSLYWLIGILLIVGIWVTLTRFR